MQITAHFGSFARISNRLGKPAAACAHKCRHPAQRNQRGQHLAKNRQRVFCCTLHSCLLPLALSWSWHRRIPPNSRMGFIRKILLPKRCVTRSGTKATIRLPNSGPNPADFSASEKIIPARRPVIATNGPTPVRSSRQPHHQLGGQSVGNGCAHGQRTTHPSRHRCWCQHHRDATNV